MGVSRNTVRKYLKQSEPVRQSNGARKRPVADEIEPRFAEIVAEWADRTTEKQRITAKRLHRQLLDEGKTAGLTVVQDWWREYRRRKAETFVPLVHRPGDEAQVDFFEVTVDLGNERRKLWMFVLRLMYSGRDFAWLSHRADQVSFLDGHVRAFEHFGAVPHRLVYDNLSAAVRRVVAPERQLTAQLTALASHYVFEPCFARPRTGHGKGGVEARGKGIRLRHLTPIPRAESLEDLNRQLLGALDAEAGERRREDWRTVMERFEEESSRMIPLMQPPFQPRRMVSCTVSRQAVVQVEGATYSVPSPWKCLQATAWVGPSTVRIECRGESVEHERLHFGGKVVRYLHYLPELAKKPQAVRQVAAELLAELGSPFDRLWPLLVDVHGPRKGARVFADVLRVVVDHGQAPVAEAVERALKADRFDLLDLASQVHAGRRPAAQVPASLAGHTVEQARAADFDRLLAEAGQ